IIAIIFEDERQHKAEDYCNYVEVQDPQVHAGEVACGNCLEAGVEGCLCLTLENYLGKSAPHEHAGERDYERGNAHVGNEVSVKGPDGDPHKECRDNSNGNWNAPVDHHDCRDGADEGDNRTHREVDVPCKDTE